MRAGERSTKYAVRNVRYESQRFRVILIVMGCFLMTMTFILSSKPEPVSIESDETQNLPQPNKPNFEDVESQIIENREDFQSDKVEPQKEPAKMTNFGAVGVDLEPRTSQKSSDLKLVNAKTVTKPAEQTKIFGDIGGNTQFEERIEEDPEQKIGTTLFDGRNLEEKKRNKENEEQNSDRDKTRTSQIPTLLDRFNENQVEVKPKDLEEFGDGENQENDNEDDKKKEAKIPSLLDRFNDNTVHVKAKEPEQSDREIKGAVWVVTNPHKTEETTISNHFEIAKAVPNSNLQCDFTDFRSDTCNLDGDIRIHANSSTIYFGDPMESMNHFHKIKPYPRKGDEMCYQRVVEFNVTSKKEVPKCTQNYDVPAILFSIGGYTGNIFHDFSDVIMPLFTASHPLNGEVRFLMTNTQSWWLIKYDKILKALSHYAPIRLDVEEANNEVHCFKRVIVGLVAHRELIIDPSRNPNHYSTQDFTRFIRQIFPLERDKPTHLGEVEMRKPRMLIISRARSRMITNLHQVVGLAQELGFEVLVEETDVGNDIIQFGQIVNSCDVMIGVHGAGLTNEMFLPPNATLIQIVPYGGLEWIGQMDYGDPAIAMGINYIQYSIALEESSLLEKYGRDNEILKNPIEFHKKGFVFIHEFFMNGQNITINLNRFRNVLINTLDKLA